MYFETLPYLIMFVLMLISMTIFALFLPETKGTPMPDHMPDKNERITFGRRKGQMILVPTSAKLVEDH
jgi:hypothetical protein